MFYFSWSSEVCLIGIWRTLFFILYNFAWEFLIWGSDIACHFTDCLCLEAYFDLILSSDLLVWNGRHIPKEKNEKCWFQWFQELLFPSLFMNSRSCFCYFFSQRDKWSKAPLNFLKIGLEEITKSFILSILGFAVEGAQSRSNWHSLQLSAQPWDCFLYAVYISFTVQRLLDSVAFTLNCIMFLKMWSFLMWSSSY